MTMAERYLGELDMINRRYSYAGFNSNTDISSKTRNGYVDRQTDELNRLDEKYGVKKTVLEKRGILKNVRYEFADGSTHEVKWF